MLHTKKNLCVDYVNAIPTLGSVGHYNISSAAIYSASLSSSSGLSEMYWGSLMRRPGMWQIMSLRSVICQNYFNITTRRYLQTIMPCHSPATVTITRQELRLRSSDELCSESTHVLRQTETGRENVGLVIKLLLLW